MKWGGQWRTRGSISDRCKRIFSPPQRPDRLRGPPTPHPTGTGTLSLGVKRPGREADHSPTSTAEVNNGGAIHPLPLRLH
jgi:hypothetical protein